VVLVGRYITSFLETGHRLVQTTPSASNLKVPLAPTHKTSNVNWAGYVHIHAQRRENPRHRPQRIKQIPITVSSQHDDGTFKLACESLKASGGSDGRIQSAIGDDDISLGSRSRTANVHIQGNNIDRTEKKSYMYALHLQTYYLLQ
jgi:hypothetical protein